VPLMIFVSLTSVVVVKGVVTPTGVFNVMIVD